jgi:hypothetical protein
MYLHCSFEAHLQQLCTQLVTYYKNILGYKKNKMSTGKEKGGETKGQE